jgi:hypothetical protein
MLCQSQLQCEEPRAESFQKGQLSLLRTGARPVSAALMDVFALLSKELQEGSM